MRTLVVEDDPSIASIVSQALKADNHAVDWLDSGMRAKTVGAVNDYDLAILDLNLPEFSGIELCSFFRSIGKSFPILFLTVCNEVEVKIKAFDSGADDFITKPFSVHELRARVSALARRPKIRLSDKLKVSDIEINLINKVVTRNGKKIPLNRKEFSLLEYLVRNKGVVLSRSDILEHVWDMNADPFTNTVDVHIQFLRKKIDKGRRNKLIHTVHGMGYMLNHER